MNVIYSRIFLRQSAQLTISNATRTWENVHRIFSQS